MPTFAAPAKINLSLRVLARRDDGFHEVETVLVPISQGDSVHMELLSEPNVLEFTCSDTSLPTDGRNLVVKAVEILRRAHGTLPGARIHLEKHVPHGAGLGGGSSDAATVLRELNALTNRPLPLADLVKLASELGSDVPFFLYGQPCVGRGRGEILTPLPNFVYPPGRLLLVKLPFGVPTPWAYQRWRDSLEIPGVDYGPQLVGEHTLVNDLERPVFEKHFVLAQLKGNLRQCPSVAASLMSGSGSTMIAFLKPDADDTDVAALRQSIAEWVGEEVWIAETDYGRF